MFNQKLYEGNTSTQLYLFTHVQSVAYRTNVSLLDVDKKYMCRMGRYCYFFFRGSSCRKGSLLASFVILSHNVWLHQVASTVNLRKNHTKRP